MTNTTDRDRRLAREWAKNWQGDLDAGISAAARVILATVDAPAPTLSEELRALNIDDLDEAALDYLADRAEKIEQDAEDRQERNRNLTKQVAALTRERDDARAEANRLTTERDEKPVQKAAESNAETPTPADVQPGEAWLVEVNRETRTAVKDTDAGIPWNTVNTNGVFHAENDDDVTLLTRLAPAPRVITNPDDLDRAKRNTIIRDNSGVVCERAPLSDGWFTTGHGTYQTTYIELPATVLWEPNP